MSKERFQVYTSSNAVRLSNKVSIWKKGAIWLAPGTVNKFDLEGYEFVTLMFDSEAKDIGMFFSGEESEGAIKYTEKGKGISINAKNFLEKHGVEFTDTMNYELVKEEGEKNVYFIKTKEGTVSARNKAKAAKQEDPKPTTKPAPTTTPTPTQEAAPVKAAPAKKAAPVKKAAPAKKAAPVKTSVK